MVAVNASNWNDHAPINVAESNHGNALIWTGDPQRPTS